MDAPLGRGIIDGFDLSRRRRVAKPGDDEDRVEGRFPARTDGEDSTRAVSAVTGSLRGCPHMTSALRGKCGTGWQSMVIQPSVQNRFQTVALDIMSYR